MVCITPATTVQAIGFEFELLAAGAAIATAATAIGMEKMYATDVALLQQKNCEGVGEHHLLGECVYCLNRRR